MTTYSQYTSTCQEIKDISSTFMEINEDKIVLLNIYSKDLNTQKLYVLEIKKYFVNICELRKKNLVNKKVPINAIVRQLHAISFNVNYLHVIHD